MTILIKRGLGSITSPLKFDAVDVGVRLISVRMIPESPTNTFDPAGGDPAPYMAFVASRVAQASINAAITDIDNLVFAAVVGSTLAVSNGVDMNGQSPDSASFLIDRVTESGSLYLHFGNISFVFELEYESASLSDTDRVMLTHKAFL